MIIRTLIALLLSLVGSVPSSAEEITSSLKATVAVIPICTVSTMPLDFGTMIAGETAMQTVSIVTKCTQNTPYQLMLDSGLHGSTSVRNMANSTGHLIAYRLYKDTTHSVEWTDGVGGATNATGTGLDFSHPLHGVATPSAIAQEGAYTDTVTVTIVY